MSIVSTEWLSKNHSKVKIIDSSWHMLGTNRDAYEEYKKEHIKDAIFFDIDKSSNKKTELPHMLPNEKDWEKADEMRKQLDEMGIILDDTTEGTVWKRK